RGPRRARQHPGGKRRPVAAPGRRIRYGRLRAGGRGPGPQPGHHRTGGRLPRRDAPRRAGRRGPGHPAPHRRAGPPVRGHVLGPGPLVPGHLLSPCLPGPVLPGPVLPGPVLPGPVLPGPVLPGPVLPGPVLPGPVLPGPVSSMTPVTGEGRPCRDSPLRAGSASPVTPVTDGARLARDSRYGQTFWGALIRPKTLPVVAGAAVGH